MNNPPLIDSANETVFSNITLRDLFAGLALTGMMIDQDAHPEDSSAFIQAVAVVSYQYADALLKAREGQ